MRRTGFIIAIAFGISIIAQLGAAEQIYVTDDLKVTFRSGPGTTNRIIKMISSGQPVEVLESQEEWSRIRLPSVASGEDEGWVLSRYLINRQPWKMQTASLLRKNTRLSNQVSTLQQNLPETERQRDELSANLKKTSSKLSELDTSYQELRSGSSQYLKLKKTLDDTQAKLKQVESDFGLLSEEYKKIKYSERNIWFATGAGILVFGLLIGIVLGKREKRRAQKYY